MPVNDSIQAVGILCRATSLELDQEIAIYIWCMYIECKWRGRERLERRVQSMSSCVV